MDTQRRIHALYRRRPIKLTTLATVDGWFITLSVHLFIQRDAREAARRAGSSATATCIYY